MAEKAAVTGNLGGKPLSPASQTKVQDALKTALHDELVSIHRPIHIEITHIDITVGKEQ